MSDEDKIAAIIAAIQDQNNLLILVLALATKSINAQSGPQLDLLMAVLGIPEV